MTQCVRTRFGGKIYTQGPAPPLSRSGETDTPSTSPHLGPGGRFALAIYLDKGPSYRLTWGIVMRLVECDNMAQFECQ